MSCSFCFANRNRDAAGRELNPKNSLPALLRKLDRAMQDEHDPIGFFLRERYPVCFSNTTDPFQRDETTYRASETFLGWCQANRVPVYLQTRGNVLHEEFDRYASLLDPGRVVAYVSLCQLDDQIRKRHEPGALSIPKRLELIRMLTDHGIPVVAACNPWVKDWVPDPEPYVEAVKDAGAVGIWWECLHLTGAQSDTLQLTYRDELLTQANVLPMFVVSVLKKWYTATEAAGLDFFPSPKWDAYFGHKARHPECADPRWLGGKTMSFAFDLMKAVCRKSQANRDAIVAFGWPEIERMLQMTGLPNVELNTEPFWYPFNASVKADHRAWKLRLGKRAGLYEIVRYFFNRPWENEHLIWYNRLTQALFDGASGDYIADERTGVQDLLALYNPSIRHHGSFTIDVDADVKRDVVVMTKEDLSCQAVEAVDVVPAAADCAVAAPARAASSAV